MVLNAFESMLDAVLDFLKMIGNILGTIFEPITNWFYEITGPVRDFLIANSRNPFLWVGLIVLGLFVFEFTFRALNKDK